MTQHGFFTPRRIGILSAGILAGLTAACAAGSAAAPRESGGDWPMYGHDASRTSFSADETSIDVAGVARLTPRFQAFVGMGTTPSSSGPVVSAGRVYVGSSASGANYFAFDSAAGTASWSADIGHLAAPSAGDVGVGSTAAVGGDAVVVGGGDAAYYALDAATGALRWRSPMDAGDGAFAWSSPLLAQGLAYVGVSAQWTALRGEIRALDVADGSIRARQSLVPEGERGADVWNSAALSPDGTLLAIATGNDYGGYDGPYTRALVTLEPSTLGIVAADREAAAGQDLDFGTTPIFFHDASGRVLVGANHKNGNFYAYAASDVAAGPIWQRRTGTQVGATPAYDPTAGAGGTLLIAGDSGVLFAVDPAKGTDRWAPVAVGLSNGTMAVANGLVFVNTGGVVTIVNVATGTVERVLQPSASGPAYSGVVIAHGVVYWMSGPYLNAWGLS
jgi:polyvinyl alcohol dehydrogenase (cytochrome)